MGCGSSASKGQADKAGASNAATPQAKAQDAPAKPSRAEDQHAARGQAAPTGGSKAEAQREPARPNLPSVADVKSMQNSKARLVPAIPGGGGAADDALTARLVAAIRGERLADLQAHVNRPGVDINALFSASAVEGSTLAFSGCTLLHLSVFLGSLKCSKYARRLACAWWPS